ncbi:Hypothetical_protein [Hexamita inflata]|uniref:Hypothetical_protein n=1 Tax=Hexamita inflata TaxID=28002 RepID=A0AA86UNQ9_9EUKA|nr:Hypothetical protein HINF_LOCUS46126 [Hexamita inflata]
MIWYIAATNKQSSMFHIIIRQILNIEYTKLNRYNNVKNGTQNTNTFGSFIIIQIIASGSIYTYKVLPLSTPLQYKQYPKCIQKQCYIFEGFKAQKTGLQRFLSLAYRGNFMDNPLISENATPSE